MCLVHDLIGPLPCGKQGGEGGDWKVRGASVCYMNRLRAILYLPQIRFIMTG